jgi:hypothetical protein
MIKRPNLQIMGVEEEQIQGKSIGNIFNKMKAGKFPSLGKERVIQVQEAFRTPIGKFRKEKSLDML